MERCSISARRPDLGLAAASAACSKLGSFRRPGALVGSSRRWRWSKLVAVSTTPWMRMPPTKSWSSADFDVLLARVTPDVVALLGDGVPRSRGTIFAALADRHPREDVKRTLMRLAVTERLVETGGKYTLPTPETEPG
jgi:hypothetical protein